ncbi:MAG: thioesterase family protein [Thermoanaerobaculia bacterium]
MTRGAAPDLFAGLPGKGPHWPVELEVPLQWGEMDAFGHVNNTVYFRWAESVRMEYFRRIGWPKIQSETGIGPILHSTQGRFRAPLVWPDAVQIATRIVDVVADRFLMLYEVRSRALGRVVFEGSGQVVAFDYRAMAKASLPEIVRERIAALETAG